MYLRANFAINTTVTAISTTAVAVPKQLLPLLPDPLFLRVPLPPLLLSLPQALPPSLAPAGAACMRVCTRYMLYCSLVACLTTTRFLPILHLSSTMSLPPLSPSHVHCALEISLPLTLLRSPSRSPTVATKNPTTVSPTRSPTATRYMLAAELAFPVTSGFQFF